MKGSPLKRLDLDDLKEQLQEDAITWHDGLERNRVNQNDMDTLCNIIIKRVKELKLDFAKDKYRYVEKVIGKFPLLMLLFCSVNLNAATIKIIHKENGVYFELKDLHPFIMYKIQYSSDLKNWKEMVRVGTHGTSMVSPYYAWDRSPRHRKGLPKEKCFFRLVENI